MSLAYLPAALEVFAEETNLQKNQTKTATRQAALFNVSIENSFDSFAENSRMTEHCQTHCGVVPASRIKLNSQKIWSRRG